MTTETETIDKLFLELSQFTKARTEREIALTASYEAMAALIDRYGLALMMISSGAADAVAVADEALSKSPRSKAEGLGQLADANQQDPSPLSEG